MSSFKVFRRDKNYVRYSTPWYGVGWRRDYSMPLGRQTTVWINSYRRVPVRITWSLHWTKMSNGWFRIKYDGSCRNPWDHRYLCLGRFAVGSCQYQRPCPPRVQRELDAWWDDDPEGIDDWV